jgi:hypothetical protein
MKLFRLPTAILPVMAIAILQAGCTMTQTFKAKLPPPEYQAVSSPNGASLSYSLSASDGRPNKETVGGGSMTMAAITKVIRVVPADDVPKWFEATFHKVLRSAGFAPVGASDPAPTGSMTMAARLKDMKSTPRGLGVHALVSFSVTVSETGKQLLTKHYTGEIQYNGSHLDTGLAYGIALSKALEDGVAKMLDDLSVIRDDTVPAV